ncbi:MAG: hypothetical protein JRI23_13175 [Deltaproteobacteria bacterium]|jgi:hypothetical protein|nr:hypothetical protein [Deltaproteobacteria bacterium]MBW2532675.1 hypothetical protein [Deltaproteobacteria bacterium]
MAGPEARRLVLRGDVARDDIDDAMERFDWRITNVFVGSATHPGQVVYATADRLSLLYLIEDPRLGVLYFAGTGPTIDTALDDVRAALPVVEMDDAVASVRTAGDEANLRESLATIVLSAGDDPSQHHIDAMRAALEHDRETVRRAALVAATYAAWRELQPTIAEMAHGDTEDALRTDAARVLQALYPT